MGQQCATGRPRGRRPVTGRRTTGRGASAARRAAGPAVTSAAVIGALAGCSTSSGTVVATSPPSASATSAGASGAATAGSPAASASAAAAFTPIVEPFDPGHPARTRPAPASCGGQPTTLAIEQCYEAKIESADRRSTRSSRPATRACRGTSGPPSPRAQEAGSTRPARRSRSGDSGRRAVPAGLRFPLPGAPAEAPDRAAVPVGIPQHHRDRSGEECDQPSCAIAEPPSDSVCSAGHVPRSPMLPGWAQRRIPRPVSRARARTASPAMDGPGLLTLTWCEKERVTRLWLMP